MTIYLLRHGIAPARDPKEYPDDDARPLTPEGRTRMAAAARGIRSAGIRFNLILTSPLPRAIQTARIVREAFKPAPALRVLDALAPGGAPQDVLAALPARVPSGVVLVGHEPDLSRLAIELLRSSRRGRLGLELKKGSLCRIDTYGEPAEGAGKLVFLLTPKILRALGRKN